METQEKIIEQFGNPELIPSEYIDGLLPKYRQGEKLDNLHSQASDLLSQLDHHSQDLTMQLEQLTAELIRASKKVNYEVELLKSDVEGLANKVDTVDKTKVDKLKQQLDTTTVDRLQRLDVVKTRMNDVQKVFEQTKRFDEGKITEAVIQCINQGDTKAAYNEIDRVAELIQVWKDTSVYPARQRFVTGLRKRVENSVNEKKEQQSRASTPNIPSRTSTPNAEHRDSSDSYYGGFLGQFTRRMGYN